ncbi:MAG: antitoxin family protein [Candidatus Tectomicrobia bacterium]|uniref:Antitoxin family protein n=1 Tax=Tectimicrobiota bacterium TaxID=2528274 RepID=A0A932CPD4_UNCTE|nr:antitoxin family protein [Candidatus Tectomicrobia bacterium]
MTKTLRAVFDGAVLRPDEPVDLKPNTRYVVTIEREEEGEESGEEGAYPLTEILELATDMGVTDLSTRHNWYAHGRMEGDRRGV